MEHVFECEERRIEAARLEKKTDRELLLEIARALPFMTPTDYKSYKDSIAFAVFGELYHEFRKKKFENTVSVVLSYKTVETEGAITDRFAIIDGLDFDEVNDKMKMSSSKIAEALVETVPESKLVKFKVDIKFFNDMRL